MPDRKRGKPKGSPKTGGRQKGTPNKSTKEIREKLTALLDDTVNSLGDISLLEDKDKIALIGKILPYIVPPAKQTETPQSESKPQTFVIAGQTIKFE